MHHFDNSPPVPLTLEGSSMLHQMLRVKWPEWRALSAERRKEILGEASTALAAAILFFLGLGRKPGEGSR